MPMQLPSKVTVVEVGPRDGLQNEKGSVPTADKIRMIEMLADAGLPQIEVTSFVKPEWIPPLADGPEVARRIRRKPGTRYSALVPNLKGYEFARAAGIDEVGLIISASETHNRKNINRSVAETLEGHRQILARAREEGARVRSYVSTSFGCPYEGAIAPDRVKEIAEALLDAGADQISLGDTTGVANPRQVTDLLERLAGGRPDGLSRYALHFHDTRGTALANVVAGLQAGVTAYDASVGGLGGCPYAPGASGNLATEDLVAMLHAMGIQTGVDLARLMEVSRFMQGVLGKELPSRYLKSQLAADAAGAKELGVHT